MTEAERCPRVTVLDACRKLYFTAPFALAIWVDERASPLGKITVMRTVAPGAVWIEMTCFFPGWTRGLSDRVKFGGEITGGKVGVEVGEGGRTVAVGVGVDVGRGVSVGGIGVFVGVDVGTGVEVGFGVEVGDGGLPPAPTSVIVPSPRYPSVACCPFTVLVPYPEA